MKTFIIATLLFLTSSSLVNANCVGSTCSKIKRPVATTLTKTKNVITAPFRRIRTNRVARQALVSP